MTDEQKQQLLVIARALVAMVNEVEKDDPELAWRPWSINRGRADPRP